MAWKWKKSDAVVSQRVSVSEIGGLLGKKVKVSDEETAIVEKAGEQNNILSNGTSKITGVFSGHDASVVMVDRSTKKMVREAEGLWSKDDRKINANIEMKFAVAEPDKVRKMLLGRRDILTVEDIWNELKKEVVSSALMPVVKKKKIDDIIDGRETEKEIQVAVEVELRKKFEIFGLELLSFNVQFMLPDEYEQYLKRRSGLREDEEVEEFREEEETKKAVSDRKTGEIKGTVETRENAIDDMQQERIKREAEMGIEEEETQQDMKDAMEALKLKEISDKQKMIKDTERKELGLEGLKEAFPGDKKKLEEKYTDLRSLISITEKKYLGRKIDDNTFKKLMQEYEKERSELEVKMKKDEK